MLQTGQSATARGFCARCALHSRLTALRQKRLNHTSSRNIDESFRRPRDDSTTYRKPNRGGPRDGYPIGYHFRPSWPRNTFRPLQNHNDRNRKASPTNRGREAARSFEDAFSSRLAAMREELKTAPLLEQWAKEVREDGGGGEKIPNFKDIWNTFMQKTFGNPSINPESTDSAEALQDLREYHRSGGEKALDTRIKYWFYAHVTSRRFSRSELENQQAVADLRHPIEWFPATRTLARTIHLHVGPTNSGKTYHALQRLEQAERGAYAGPLRLLAHEVYTRMNAKGKKCTLITGEEKRQSEGADGTQSDPLTSCTVEMIPLNSLLDVAVIDEIQMIGSRDRGWAWTQAVLGVKAKEVHLCGEERTVPLIRELCAITGEKLEIHRYQRLSPLKVADESLDGDLSKLRKGDCIVSFSVMGIHALRNQIEKITRRKVAIVYGSLPPETRAQQARLFNDPNNDYDFLVASDAIGMGLNLAIKRVIFESSTKSDGFRRHTLSVADIKQIGGRAGRFRTAAQVNEVPAREQDVAAAKGDASTRVVENENLGIVTTLEQFDFPVISSGMSAEPEPIVSAGLQPPASVITRFASYFPPGTPFSFILTRLHEISSINPRFHLCALRDQIWIADLIEPVQGLTIADRDILTSAPAGVSDASLWTELMPALARCIAEQKGGSIVDLKELPLEILEKEVSQVREYLRELEQLHKGIVAYLWLSYRFAGIFTTRALAFHVKQMVEQKIEQVLSNLSFSEARRRKIVAQREEQLLRELNTKNDNVVPGDPSAVEDGDVRSHDGGDTVKDVITGERRNTVNESNTDFSLDELLDDADPSLAKRLEHQTASHQDGDRLGNDENIPVDEPVAFAESEKPVQSQKVSGSG